MGFRISLNWNGCLVPQVCTGCHIKIVSNTGYEADITACHDTGAVTQDKIIFSMHRGIGFTLCSTGSSVGFCICQA